MSQDDVNIDTLAPDQELIKAAQEGDLSKVIHWLEQGANIDAREYDRDWDTAVNWAASRGHISVVNYLIDLGADLEIPDSGNRTPIICASRDNALECVLALIHADVNLNVQDKNGNTALMNAVNNENIAVIQALLVAGADPFIKNNEGQMAIELKRDERIFNILNKYCGVDGDVTSGSKFSFVNGHIVCADNGHVQGVGSYKSLFNFRAQKQINMAGGTVLDVQRFDELSEADQNHMAAAYAWAEEQGQKLPTPEGVKSRPKTLPSVKRL